MRLRVIDLDDVAAGLDAQVLDRDAVHLDAHARLVVGDDVDLPADETHLELSDVLQVDHAVLARLDQPLLVRHVFLRVDVRDSRYIALG